MKTRRGYKRSIVVFKKVATYTDEIERESACILWWQNIVQIDGGLVF